MITMTIGKDTTIRELWEEGLISVRTFNVFKYYGIKSVGEILRFTDGDKEKLLKFRNFGKKSLWEVSRLLERIDAEQCIQEDSAGEETVHSANHVTAAYEETFCGNDEISAVARNTFPTSEAIRDAISSGEYDFLTIHGEIGREGNIKLRNLYLHFVVQVIQEYYNTPLPHDPLFNKFESLRIRLVTNIDEFSLMDDIEYFVSPTKRALIERYYHRLASRLSMRALRLLQEKMPTYREVIPYFGRLLYEYNSLCPGQNMQKTLNEIYQFVQNFDDELHVILALSPHEDLVRDVSETFPFLKSNQIKVVAQYREEHHSIPMFYVLYFYLKSSDNRTDYVFALLNGIRDGEFHTMAEAGNILHLTRERVRQLSVKELAFLETELARHEGWGNYSSLFALPYITELSPKFRMLKEEEPMVFGFEIFARMVPLVAPFRRYQVQGKTILVNNELLHDCDLDSVLGNVDNIFHERYTRDTDFRLQDIIGKVPENQRDDAQGLMTYILSEAYGCQVTEDGRFTIEQNRIDVSQEIYDILFRNGQPMHIEEIFEAFKNLYPEHRYEDSRFLRSYIQRNPHIQAIGNTSTYALDSWDVYCGGVRDRLREILNQAKEPMTVDDIVEKVLEVVPYTNRASILSSMDSDDFVSYKQDRWGLASKEYDERFQRNLVGRKRKAFDGRYDEFKDFVESYHRFPFSTGGEHEQTLFRWINNVRSGAITTTDEQRGMFETTIKTFQEMRYPENTSEYKCQERCSEYREYLEENFELPTRQGNEELYMWMYKMKRDYNGLTENNRYYLKELFDYIRSYGFCI